MPEEEKVWQNVQNDENLAGHVPRWQRFLNSCRARSCSFGCDRCWQCDSSIGGNRVPWRSRLRCRNWWNDWSFSVIDTNTGSSSSSIVWRYGIIIHSRASCPISSRFTIDAWFSSRFPIYSSSINVKLKIMSEQTSKTKSTLDSYCHCLAAIWYLFSSHQAW